METQVGRKPPLPLLSLQYFIIEKTYYNICAGADSYQHAGVGNMMWSVVLDGNPLNEDEDMILLACVVLDGIPPDEVILDMMNLVNDVNLM